MARYSIPNQTELFNAVGDAVFPNVDASHVAGVSTQIPATVKAAAAPYVINTSQRSFSTLEQLSQVLSKNKENNAREPYGKLTPVEFNAVRCLALLTPPALVRPDKINFVTEFNGLGKLTEPTTPVSVKDDAVSIDLLRPVKLISAGGPAQHIARADKDKFYSGLHSVVVGASKKMDFEKFAGAWGKADAESREALPKIHAYATQVNRPLALSVLKERLKMINDAILERRGNTDQETHEYATRAQTERVTQEAIAAFFEASPAKKSDSMTNNNLDELSKNPRPVYVGGLIDDMDAALLKMVSRTHNYALLGAYQKEAGNNLVVLDEALKSPQHALHKVAEVLYTARWAQLMEGVAEGIRKKPVTLFPQMESREI